MKILTSKRTTIVLLICLSAMAILCAGMGFIAWYAFVQSMSDKQLYRALVFSITRSTYSNLLNEAEALRQQYGDCVLNNPATFPPAMSVLLPQYIIVGDDVEIQLSGGFDHRSVLIGCATGQSPSERGLMSLHYITNRLYYYEE